MTGSTILLRGKLPALLFSTCLLFGCAVDAGSADPSGGGEVAQGQVGSAAPSDRFPEAEANSPLRPITGIVQGPGPAHTPDFLGDLGLSEGQNRTAPAPEITLPDGIPSTTTQISPLCLFAIRREAAAWAEAIFVCGAATAEEGVNPLADEACAALTRRALQFTEQRITACFLDLGAPPDRGEFGHSCQTTSYNYRTAELNATCLTARGAFANSSINLAQHITNVDGTLTWGGGAYQASCSGSTVVSDPSTPNAGPMLVGLCYTNGARARKLTRLRLDAHIININGVMTYIP